MLDPEMPDLRNWPNTLFQREDTHGGGSWIGTPDYMQWMYNSGYMQPGDPQFQGPVQPTKGFDITKLFPWLGSLLGGPMGQAIGQGINKHWDYNIFGQGNSGAAGGDLSDFVNRLTGGDNFMNTGPGPGGTNTAGPDPNNPMGSGSGLPNTSTPGASPYDWDAIMKMFMGGGSGGGGGGGNKGSISKNPVAGGADYLSNMFKTGGAGVGEFDPALLNIIGGLQGQNTGEYADLTNFIKGQGGDIISMLMGGLDPGGGGGGSYNYSGGGGPAGGYQTQSIADLFKGIPGLELDKLDVGLKSLPPDVVAQLDAIRAANQGQLETQRKSVTDDLLTRMFGAGIERSTVAGEASARAASGLEQSLLDLQGQDAARRLGLQTDESNRRLQADLAKQGFDVDVYKSKLGSSTNVLQSQIAADAQLKAASIGANAAAASSAASSRAALEGARLNTLANIFDTQVRGLTSGFGDRSSVANNFGNIFGSLASKGADVDLNRFLGIGEIAQGDIASARSAAASRAATSASAAANRQNAFLDFLKFQESVRSNDRSFDLDQKKLDLQKYLGDLDARTSLSINKKSGADTWAKILGAIGTFYSGYKQGQTGSP